MDSTTPSRPSVSYPTTTPSEPITSTIDTSALRHGSFFDKEREKLVSEIAQGIESLLSSSNALNRKLEESISVGKEFEPIAGLWGKFAQLMNQVGIPDPYADRHRGSHSPSGGVDAAVAQRGGEEEQMDAEAAEKRASHRRSTGWKGEEATNVEQTLPPGVAPGGGTIYN